MPFFSSKKKVKLDLTEHHRDKKKMGKNVDPTRAITEEEPWAIAQQAGKGISQIRHKDIHGNEITDPDRSNPTRHRMERPLDTIRSFEKAISGDYDRDYLPRRSNRLNSTYDQQNSQRASVAYQYGDQSARQSIHENGTSSHAQRPYNQHRNSGYDQAAQGARYRVDVPSDSNSGTYSNGAGSGLSGDPYSTNPSSDASGYVNYDQQQLQQQQQYGQSSRLPLGSNDKPLPNVYQNPSDSPPVDYHNSYTSQPQYNQPQQNGSYSGHSQFAPQHGQYRQPLGQQQQPQPGWNQQPLKTAVTKSSAATDGKSEKRKSWFRRSKS
ncbi:hypothetical protein ABW20_dc0105549 [Dactylellina cionopaga]|nr:hypothetical protein ABW20_dc0105549 [Dactylellina cionopaga]